MKEDVRASLILVFGFIAGASAVSWLVLTDPEVRMMYRAKANRIEGKGWQGLVREVARSVVVELRSSFPKLTLGDE